MEISSPYNPVHLTHVGYNLDTGEFTVSWTLDCLCVRVCACVFVYDKPFALFEWLRGEHKEMGDADQTITFSCIISP